MQLTPRLLTIGKLWQMEIADEEGIIKLEFAAARLLGMNEVWN